MKNPLTSKTLWFALALILIGVLEPLIGQSWVVYQLAGEHAEKVLVIIGAIVAVLRILTKDPVVPPATE